MHTILRFFIALFFLFWGAQSIQAQDYSSSCDPSFLIGEWSGEMKQYSYNIYASYPVVMRISSVEGCSFTGDIIYPSHKDGLTRIKGQIAGDSIFWTEHQVVQGENLVLDGLFLVNLTDKSELTGKWYTPTTMQEGGSFYLRKEWSVPNFGTEDSPPLSQSTPEPPAAPELDKPALPFPRPAKELLDRPIKTSPHPIAVYSEEVTLYIWDSKTEDGDIISLNFNGTWLVKNHTLTKEKKGFPITLKPGSLNQLVSYANDLGKSPPTTTSISFFDGRHEREFYLRSDLESCGAVRFILQP